MRRAGLVVGRSLAAMCDVASPGMTTRELDVVARECLREAGATSNFLGYEPGYGIPPYPAVVCLSVNEEVVHGIPGDRVLAEGDLLSIDFGAIANGYHGDAARSVLIGDVDEPVFALAKACEASMWAGIGAAKLGGTIGDISAGVERSIHRSGSYGIVRDYTGHGIGHAMHQEPSIPNYGRPRSGATIRPGMCLCIEPMLTMGSPRVDELDDGWTVVTHDGSLAAHWENTITVTKHGLWVLTELDGGEEMLSRLGLPFGPLAD